MSRLTELLRQARKADPQLGADLEAEITALTKSRTFGLVFERHQPEAVELPGRAVRRGNKVRVLPPRGVSTKGDQRLWRVERIERTNGRQVAHLKAVDADEPETQTVPADDLVVVAEFKDRIYPGLVETGRVERGGDKPFHTVINAENYHALEMLTYTHRHRVDCIYIDPPYNTGARDWKYNNNYVESDDDYRHSKWLAFMERRLEVARELLNPDDSVLIVTIDEKEVHRLGLLVHQVFPESSVQMVTTVTNQRGVARGQEFARVDEYALVVFVGNLRVAQGVDDMLTSEETAAKQRIDIWNRLMRRGTDSQRQDSPRQFYPIFIDPQKRAIVGVGDPLPLDVERESITAPDGTIAVWPLRTNGTEGRWTLGHRTLQRYAKEGHAKVGAYNKKRDTWSISYLIAKDLKRIEQGEIKVLGRDDNGVLLLELADSVHRRKLPRTVWLRDSHNAGTYGSAMLRKFISDRRFPFPKSLYLVEDMLRVFIADKPDAVVLDFFAGSGTTSHAAMRLNRQDGGRRQCISVTNNEISADEEHRLRKQGLRPGDPKWEASGIYEHITVPRVTAAITGTTPQDEPIEGDYKFTDEFPMRDGFEENAAYFKLTYEAPLSIKHHRAFERIAPMLWLRAGSLGRIITALGPAGWDVAEAYAVLANLDQTDSFTAAVAKAEGVATVFIVTDDDSAFQMVCRDLPAHILPVRLYESYLQNFEINIGGR